MLKRREGHWTNLTGLHLFFQVWDNPRARGNIIIAHGHGEHTDSYQRLIQFFENDQWNFFASDCRGHGRSDGKRGYAEDFKQYCDDYHSFVQKVSEEIQPGQPLVLLGHSMGGLIQLKTLLDHPDVSATAQVCSAPLLGVSVPVPPWKDKGAQIINQWAPKITLSNEITNQMLSRDPEVIREYEQDVLRHHRMSPGVYLGIQNAIQQVQARAEEIKIPTLLQISDEDPVVSTSEARKFFDALGSPDKKLLLYGDGARHEIYNDTIRDQANQDLKTYLDSVLEKFK